MAISYALSIITHSFTSGVFLPSSVSWVSLKNNYVYYYDYYLQVHPRNKLLLYHRYVFSKISRHFTVKYLGQTWISEHLDNIVSKFIRQWFELPISATLSSIILPSKKFGLAFQLPSVKFQQCQTVLRSSLKSSKDESIVKLWKNTNCGTNILYDVYKNIKQILKSIRTEHMERLQTELPSQGFIISFLLVHSLKYLNSLWSRAQIKLPANIFNFTIKYLNNRLERTFICGASQTLLTVPFVFSLSHFSTL